MATEWEVPMAACCSAASVAASLIPPPNQNDSFMVAADDDQFASFCGRDFFSASVSCNSSRYCAPEKSAVAGSSLLSSVFQAEHSSFDLYVPQCEDEAELEWLSRFMEESSFSDVEPAPPAPPSCAAGKPDVGRGARSKRPRLAMTSASSSSSSEFPSDGAGQTKKGRVARRCTHCASENTPQWRTGPLGPKTLCNACGVRYKSGRLVPEYRPAASPTFVLTQHSNSHRKVMELRRQKELLRRHHP
ncbi:GATA transcription factor 4-like [Curcuma longa]|uniref:GATA transcription factor 4-like n=1 Tax=Curcuma longa TaxID=136217 RepID=UPI003D9F4703